MMQAKQDDIEANYSRFQMNLALLYFFLITIS